MTTLHDRLADLADDAPASLPDPGLWDRGRRYHRRRRRGTLAILGTAVVVLTLLVAVSGQRSVVEPAQAPASGKIALPDRVWTPSPWLPSTDRPGRLVAVTSADRGRWTGTDSGVVGVSAATGEYTFLDLAGVNPGHASDIALSPDGTRVAYWTTGVTTGTPNTSFSSEPVAGVAVLDTTTGKVVRHPLASEHGLEPELLTWADRNTLVFGAGQIVAGDDGPERDQGGYRSGPVLTWQPGQAPAELPLGGSDGSDVIAAGHGRLVVDRSDEGRGRMSLIHVDDSTRDRPISFAVPDFRRGALLPVAIDATGQRVARVVNGRNPNRMRAGDLDHQLEVPGSRGTFAVLGWLDDDTVVAWRSLTLGGMHAGLVRVSVSTGRSQVLTRFPDFNWGNFQFATDLLDAPTVHAQKPPSPADPRVVTGLAVMIGLVALGALVLWRRRVRP